MPARAAVLSAALLLACAATGEWVGECAQSDKEYFVRLCTTCCPQFFKEADVPFPDFDEIQDFNDESQCRRIDARLSAPCLCLANNFNATFGEYDACTITTARVRVNKLALTLESSPSCPNLVDECECAAVTCSFRCTSNADSSCFDQMVKEPLPKAATTAPPAASAPAADAENADKSGDNGGDVGSVWNWLGPVLGIVGAVIGAAGAVIAALLGHKRKRRNRLVGGRAQDHSSESSSASSSVSPDEPVA